MTDAEREALVKEVNDSAPRFSSYQNAVRFQSNPDDKFTIPQFSRVDGHDVLNPEWVDAPYTYRFIFWP